MVRLVMAMSTWPEGEPDFSVTTVRDGETDAKAIERAEVLYYPGMDFYIVEVPEGEQMITTQKELRAEFWRTHPQFKRQPGWKQNQYPTDVRVTWCEWVDDMYQSDQISKGLVELATL